MTLEIKERVIMRMNQMSLIRNSVDGEEWGEVWLKKCSMAEKPCRWLVYGEVTSTITIMVLGGRGGIR